MCPKLKTNRMPGCLARLSVAVAAVGVLPGTVVAIITLRWWWALAAARRCGLLRWLLRRALAGLLLHLLRLLRAHLLHLYLSLALRLLLPGALFALDTGLLLRPLLHGALLALSPRLTLRLLLALRCLLSRHLLLLRPLLPGGGVSLSRLLRTLRLRGLLPLQRLRAGTWLRNDIGRPDLSFRSPVRRLRSGFNGPHHRQASRGRRTLRLTGGAECRRLRQGHCAFGMAETGGPQLAWPQRRLPGRRVSRRGRMRRIPRGGRDHGATAASGSSGRDRSCCRACAYHARGCAIRLAGTRGDQFHAFVAPFIRRAAPAQGPHLRGRQRLAVLSGNDLFAGGEAHRARRRSAPRDHRTRERLASVQRCRAGDRPA
jgi:hypothetical protein